MLDREADQNAAMTAIAPILGTIYNILDQSVAFYLGPAYSDEARADHDDRAMANCIYSHAERRMLSAAATVPASAIKVRGLHVLNYRDQTLARFKKVTADGRHRNYQTKQQRDYDDQLLIPGLPVPAYRLTAGYQLDASGSSLERIMIARPLGPTVFWTAQVSLYDGSAKWEDITPKRFAGTGVTDFDQYVARNRRG